MDHICMASKEPRILVDMCRMVRMVEGMVRKVEDMPLEDMGMARMVADMLALEDMGMARKLVDIQAWEDMDMAHKLVDIQVWEDMDMDCKLEDILACKAVEHT